jgi:hypothetical protein
MTAGSSGLRSLSLLIASFRLTAGPLTVVRPPPGR